MSRFEFIGESVEMGVVFLLLVTCLVGLVILACWGMNQVATLKKVDGPAAPPRILTPEAPEP